MFLGIRRTGVLGLLDRRRTGAVTKSGRGAAFGGLVSLAAPFLLRKLVDRRARATR